MLVATWSNIERFSCLVGSSQYSILLQVGGILFNLMSHLNASSIIFCSDSIILTRLLGRIIVREDTLSIVILCFVNIILGSCGLS
jgi:hypothetical protein